MPLSRSGSRAAREPPPARANKAIIAHAPLPDGIIASHGQRPIASTSNGNNIGQAAGPMASSPHSRTVPLLLRAIEVSAPAPEGPPPVIAMAFTGHPELAGARRCCSCAISQLPAICCIPMPRPCRCYLMASVSDGLRSYGDCVREAGDHCR